MQCDESLRFSWKLKQTNLNKPFMIMTQCPLKKNELPCREPDVHYVLITITLKEDLRLVYKVFAHVLSHYKRPGLNFHTVTQRQLKSI